MFDGSTCTSKSSSISEEFEDQELDNEIDSSEESTTSESESSSSSSESQSEDEKVSGRRSNRLSLISVNGKANSKPPRKKLKTHSTAKDTKRLPPRRTKSMENGQCKGKVAPKEMKKPGRRSEIGISHQNGATKSLKENNHSKPPSIPENEVVVSNRPKKYKKNKTKKKIDPEVIIKAFEKPSEIYASLRNRYIENPMILQRNLSYMKTQSKKTSRKERFKLPELWKEGNKSRKIVQTPSPKKARRSNSLQIDPKSYSLTLVPCKVSGKAPESSKSKDNEYFFIDFSIVRVHQGHDGKEKSSDQNGQAVVSGLPIEFDRKDVIHDQYFPDENDDTGKDKSMVRFDGNDLFPPNGYTHGYSLLKIKAKLGNTAWVYHGELRITQGREKELVNGLYDVNLKPSNGADEIIGAHFPVLHFATYWMPSDVDLTYKEVKQRLKKEVQMFKKPLAISKHKPVKEEIPLSPQSSPSRSILGRNRIDRVTYFLTDRVDREPGIPASLTNPLQCPWCMTNCPHLLALLRHLRCWHPRLNFLLQPEKIPRCYDIVVTLNNRYSCCEEFSHPANLTVLTPLMNYGVPVKRLPSTQLVWITNKHKPRKNFHKATTSALAEFRRSENQMNPFNVIMVAGHLR